MNRLELIVMPRTLPPEEARALLDQYAEGALDEETRQAVEAALAEDADLQVAYREMAGTLAALRALPRPEEPEDMVAKVRARLRAEKAEALAAAERASEAELDLEPPEVSSLRSRRALFIEIGLAASAAAALAIGVFFAAPSGEPSTGVGAAGVSGAEAVSATLTVRGLAPERVQALAKESGLLPDSADGLVFTGDRRAAARFRMALLREASGRPGAVEGMLPDGDEVTLRVAVVP